MTIDEVEKHTCISDSSAYVIIHNKLNREMKRDVDAWLVIQSKTI